MAAIGQTSGSIKVFDGTKERTILRSDVERSFHSAIDHFSVVTVALGAADADASSAVLLKLKA